MCFFFFNLALLNLFPDTAMGKGGTIIIIQDKTLLLLNDLKILITEALDKQLRIKISGNNCE